MEHCGELGLGECGLGCPFHIVIWFQDGGGWLLDLIKLGWLSRGHFLLLLPPSIVLASDLGMTMQSSDKEWSSNVVGLGEGFQPWGHPASRSRLERRGMAQARLETAVGGDRPESHAQAGSSTRASGRRVKNSVVAGTEPSFSAVESGSGSGARALGRLATVQREWPGTRQYRRVSGWNREVSAGWAGVGEDGRTSGRLCGRCVAGGGAPTVVWAWLENFPAKTWLIAPHNAGGEWASG